MEIVGEERKRRRDRRDEEKSGEIELGEEGEEG